ncbi:MAG: hypothetical protein HYV28_05085 [Ignavibacteriales bacterium]|nr:hypothetical protein [Ignavibacteriales bacterium]
MITVYLAGTLQLPDRRIELSFLTVKNGMLLQFGSLDDFTPPDAGEIIDMSGRTLLAETNLQLGKLITIERSNNIYLYNIITESF